MKTRSISSRRIGERLVRWTTKIVDDPSEEGSDLSGVQLRRLFQDLAESPALLMCGSELCEKLTITHNGTSWVLEAQADVCEEHPQQS